MIVSCGAATHTGLRRSLNEDAHLAQAPLFLVADGMGGHEAGERASAAVVAEFQRLVGRDSIALDDVRFALTVSRGAVEALAADGAAGAGTTVSGVVVASVGGMGYWLALNIGDSRTYRYSGGELEQITVDHSVVQELIDSGELTPEEARTDPRRNIITRAIGGGSVGEADYWLFPAEVGDRMLICSDGLTSEVDDQRILEVLAQETDPRRAADLLTAEAMDAGGRDNITVIVVDAVSVATHPGSLVHSDAVVEDTRPRETVNGGVR